MTERYDFRFERDSVERTLEMVGDRWTFLILREAFFGVTRFGQLQRNLGIARNILSARLRMLVDAGLLERRRYHADPDWFEYHLTKMGRDLYPAIVALMRWGDEHLAGPEGAPLILHHDPCGHDAAPVLVCAHCGEAVRPEDITPEPGPGAAPASRAKPRRKRAEKEHPSGSGGRRRAQKRSGPK